MARLLTSDAQTSSPPAATTRQDTSAAQYAEKDTQQGNRPDDNSDDDENLFDLVKGGLSGNIFGDVDCWGELGLIRREKSVFGIRSGVYTIETRSHKIIVGVRWVGELGRTCKAPRLNCYCKTDSPKVAG